MTAQSDRVLLTGISGFLGGHVALELLKHGYSVRGSVRNLARADQVRSTLVAHGADPARLEFVALDLLADAGWDEAMAGCRYVQHVASPFVLQQPRDTDAIWHCGVFRQPMIQQRDEMRLAEPARPDQQHMMFAGCCGTLRNSLQKIHHQGLSLNKDRLKQFRVSSAGSESPDEIIV